MSVLTDTLTRAGYELISIGSEVFPCTIMHDGEPIGFLKQDGVVSLLPEYEQSRGELESVAAYAQEFKDLEQSGQGLVMPELEAGAERWATERGGRSPRCARQFIRAAEAKIKRGQPV